MSVSEFVATESRRPFDWGVTDCASTVDRWVRSVTGISPLDSYGRRYASEAEAKAWLAEANLAVLMNRCMRAAGFKKTLSPQAGDVGLVFSDGRLCAAIFTGSMWFSHDIGGVIGAPEGAMWKAWRVADGTKGLRVAPWQLGGGLAVHSRDSHPPLACLRRVRPAGNRYQDVHRFARRLYKKTS